MNLTRNGKIARLPHELRQQLNHRLQDGEQGKKLVAWLNALPEVKAIVAAEFGGRRIREQNLSEWKQGGYREWLEQQEARELVEELGEDAADWAAEDRPPLSETLARWVTAPYAAATRRISAAEGPEGWRLLREMCADMVELQRGEHSAQRLALERERVAAVKQDANMRWKRKVAMGPETFAQYVG